jgi:hypothetical protein
MTEKHDLSPPILTPDKPLYVFMKELKEHTLKKIKPKYDLILEFINKSCNLELKFLKDFKKYNLSKINIDNFEKILDDYKYKLEGELSIDIDDLHMDIVKILSDCLSSIDYSIHSHREKNEKTGKIKIFLTIIDEPKKENHPENKPIIPKEVKDFEKENNKIKREKRKHVLKFVNDLFDTKLKSLKNFSNINISNIDEEKQDDIISKHKENLESEFDIEIDDDDNIESILKKCIKTIGYELKKTKVKDEKTKKTFVFLDIVTSL